MQLASCCRVGEGADPLDSRTQQHGKGAIQTAQTDGHRASATGCFACGLTPSGKQALLPIYSRRRLTSNINVWTTAAEADRAWLPSTSCFACINLPHRSKSRGTPCCCRVMTSSLIVLATVCVSASFVGESRTASCCAALLTRGRAWLLRKLPAADCCWWRVRNICGFTPWAVSGARIDTGRASVCRRVLV